MRGRADWGAPRPRPPAPRRRHPAAGVGHPCSGGVRGGALPHRGEFAGPSDQRARDRITREEPLPPAYSTSHTALDLAETVLLSTGAADSWRPDRPAPPYYRHAMTAAGKHQASRPIGRRLERAGIRDVAAAAGVSITTVSDALNGKGRLPDATRSHVREVAERLGYRPSAAARTLRTGRSGLIGLTVTTYGEEPFTFTEFAYFAEMARAATSAALARGYALVILPASSRHDVWGNVALDGTVVI